MFEILAGATKQQTEIKGMQIGKEVKVLFIDNTLLYITESRNSTRKYLQTKNKFAMWQDTESTCNNFSIHQQKTHRRGPWTHYHSFIRALKKIKYLGTNLTKEVNYLYNETLHL